MKLAIKLALAVLPGALVIVAAAAFVEIGRDRAELEADEAADDQAMAGAFADGAGKVWEAVGESAARTAMQRIRGFDHPARYRVSWIDLGGNRLPAAERAALARGEPVLWHETHGNPQGWLHAVAPVRAHGRSSVPWKWRSRRPTCALTSGAPSAPPRPPRWCWRSR